MDSNQRYLYPYCLGRSQRRPYGAFLWLERRRSGRCGMTQRTEGGRFRLDTIAVRGIHGDLQEKLY